MINHFKEIGGIKLEKTGFYQTDLPVEKRKILLNHQSLKPYGKKDKEGRPTLDGKAICLNFDLKKNLFEFKLSQMDLDESNKQDIFAFRLGAPKDKKKFLSTNNLDAFLSSVFVQSQEYLSKKRNQKKSRDWFKKNVSTNYDKLLKVLLETFYIQDDRLMFLDPEKLVPDQKMLFTEIKSDAKDNAKTDELFIRLLNRHFFKSDTKSTVHFPTIALVTINDQHILEFEHGAFKNDYINLCYYDLLERFFIEDIKSGKNCHLCSSKDDVIQNMPFSMKFYGTTNELNFENIKKSNAYKSFALCKTCFEKTITGMKYVEQYFSNYLFDMNYYLIPHADKAVPLNTFSRVTRLLKNQGKRYADGLEMIKGVLEQANRKTVRFDLFFFFSPAGSQQFDVLQYISDIDLHSLAKRFEMFDRMTEIYALDKIGKKYNHSLTLHDLRFFLFPSDNTHGSSPDPKTFRKDLLDFLAGFLSDLPLNYNDLIKRFINIYRKRMHRDRIDDLSPFKMVLFLSIMLNLNKLKGGKSVNSGNFVSTISRPEYEDFFNTHGNVYGGQAFRQGLFLLGTIISKIKTKQKDKKINFYKKLNFGGIPVRRVPLLILQVKEYAEIYQVYEEPGIWGNIMDRLQGIESSRIKSDEILFYILTGISFEEYLNKKFFQEKALAEGTKSKGEKQDDHR
jgi:CRISPR-associated protein Csh1